MTLPATTTKIRVRNYQSIADAKIEVNGLTVVTGRSNMGKSALIRAVGAMLFGAPGEAFIKNGESWAGGAIVIEDGAGQFYVKWRKVKPQARTPNLQPALEINGTMHTKIGREHKDLVAPFGIAEIETSTTRFRPQIASQFDGIFLVTANDTAVAEVFKVLGRVDIITEAQKDAKKEHKETLDRKAIRREDTETQKARVKEFENTPILRQQVTELRARVTAIREKLASAQDALTKCQWLQSYTIRPLPDPLPPLPNPPQVREQITMLLELQTLTTRPLPDPLDPLLPPPHTNELSQLRQLAAANKTLADLDQSLALAQSKLDEIGPERARLEKELGICPTCQRAFTGDHTHD
jgi:uncharacterized protein YhaN